MRLPPGDWALAAAAAVALTLAYPPFELLVPAFVCLIPAGLLILRGARDEDAWRRHLHQGFWYGAITHGALLYWFGVTLWSFGRGAVWLWIIAAVMFGGGNAVMFAVVGKITRRSQGRLVLALPAGVVFTEWLASQLGPIGFPWHQLALTVSPYPVLVQIADLAGTGGLTFLVAMVNVLLALAWWNRASRRRAWAYVEAVAFVLFATTVYGLYRLQTLPLASGARVAVVQPNVSAEEKWRPEGQDRIVQRTTRLTEQAIADLDPALIVWPETALPGVLSSHPRWASRVTQLVGRSRTTVLTGGIEAEASASGERRRYNSAFAFAAASPNQPRVVHRKQKLVPMIEQVTWSTLDLSRTGIGGFTPGRGVRVSTAEIGRYGTLLCYELTFPGMARELRRSGAEVLVVLSNDAWMGRTAAAHQHFAHATLRAVENRVTVVRAANTGVSGIVDPLGRVVTETRRFEPTYAGAQLRYVKGVPFAAYVGGWVGPLSLGVLLTLLALPKRPRSATSWGPPRQIATSCDPRHEVREPPRRDR